MPFNSIEFLFFLPAVALVYFLLPDRVRWIWLLGASYFYYSRWRVDYVFLVATATALNYYVGLALFAVRERSTRTTLFVLAVAANLALLSTFKYSAVLVDALNAAGAFGDSPWQPTSFGFLLPIGISFYTFQNLSYVIDIYRGRRDPERHFGIYALYISFFPQLVAGPIERSTHLLPQFRQRHRFDLLRIESGIALILWGLFKKVVIADRLAIYVDAVYATPSEHTASALVLATYFFPYQLYCDFSGYSDIAIGSARILGYDLIENFRRPFAARTLAEFWQRWHISLTRWIFDYVHTPLVRRARLVWQRRASIFLVFLLIGLWHGATPNFIAFGAFMGGLMAFAESTRKHRVRWMARLLADAPPGARSIVTGLRILVTFHLVLFACVLFRCQELSDALVFVDAFAKGWPFTPAEALIAEVSTYELSLGFASILVLELVQSLQARRPAWFSIRQQPVLFRLPAYYATALACMMFGETAFKPFVYFLF